MTWRPTAKEAIALLPPDVLREARRLSCMGRTAEQLAEALPLDITTAKYITTRSARARRQEAKRVARRAAPSLLQQDDG